MTAAVGHPGWLLLAAPLALKRRQSCSCRGQGTRAGAAHRMAGACGAWTSRRTSGCCILAAPMEEALGPVRPLQAPWAEAQHILMSSQSANSSRSRRCQRGRGTSR